MFKCKILSCQITIIRNVASKVTHVGNNFLKNVSLTPPDLNYWVFSSKLFSKHIARICTTVFLMFMYIVFAKLQIYTEWGQRYVFPTPLTKNLHFLHGLLGSNSRKFARLSRHVLHVKDSLANNIFQIWPCPQPHPHDK